MTDGGGGGGARAGRGGGGGGGPQGFLTVTISFFKPNLRLLSLFRPRQLIFFYFFHNTQLEMYHLGGPDQGHFTGEVKWDETEGRN